MPLVTFTSDFGTRDHYVGQVKAYMLSEAPEQSIIDVSHGVQPYDITHMAHVLDSVFRDFSQGTIHFVGHDEESGYLIAWLEGHYFIVPNNGIISLISERRPDLLISIKEEGNALKTAAQVAIKLAKGAIPESFGEPCTNYKEYTKRKSRATKKEIAGQVVSIDHFGNLITNIELTDFRILSKDKNLSVHFGRETLDKVNQKMQDVEPGDAFAIFNTNEKLVLGIYQGNGSELLGLEFDSPITIIFKD